MLRANKLLYKYDCRFIRNYQHNIVDSTIRPFKKEKHFLQMYKPLFRVEKSICFNRFILHQFGNKYNFWKTFEYHKLLNYINYYYLKFSIVGSTNIKNCRQIHFNVISWDSILATMNSNTITFILHSLNSNNKENIFSMRTKYFYLNKSNKT